MVVRRANTGDIDVLSSLVAKYWQFERLPGFSPAVVRTLLKRLLSSPDLGAVWLATDAQQPLGYLIVVYIFSLEHQGISAEIDEFFVVANHRASGVGSQLLREAEAELVRQGCKNISLQISIANRQAQEFYARHGYSRRSRFLLLEKSLGAV